MNHKGIKLMFLLIFPLYLAGCTVSYPIEDLGICYVLAIDKGEESHHDIAVRIPVFELNAEENATFIEGQGLSIRDALRKINGQTEKHLVIGQTRAVVIGEELAKTGIDSHLDLLTREPEFPLGAGVLISDKKAKDFIKDDMAVNPRLGDYLKKAVKTWQDNGFILGISLNHFYVRKDAGGWDPCLPHVKRDGDKIAEIGIALFRDDKMVGQLNKTESQLLVLLSTRPRTTIITFDDPLEPDTEGADRKYVSVEIDKAKNKVKTSLEDGVVQVDMQVKMDVDIVDNESYVNLTHPHTLKVYEESFSKEFSRRAKDLIEKLQELQVDPLGIGAYFRMQNYDLWKSMNGDENWRDFWQSANIRITADVTIKRFGVVIK